MLKKMIKIIWLAGVIINPAYAITEQMILQKLETQEKRELAFPLAY